VGGLFFIAAHRSQIAHCQPQRAFSNGNARDDSASATLVGVQKTPQNKPISGPGFFFEANRQVFIVSNFITVSQPWAQTPRAKSDPVSRLTLEDWTAGERLLKATRA
jgi:hypothetical protein